MDFLMSTRHLTKSKICIRGYRYWLCKDGEVGVKYDFSLKSHWWISRRRRVDPGRYTSGQVETALPAWLNAKALTEEINCSCTEKY